MNFKRHRPKHQRAGCLMCKPHKDDRGANGVRGKSVAVRRIEQDADTTWPPMSGAMLDFAMFEQYERPYEPETNETTDDAVYLKYLWEHGKGPLAVPFIEVARWASSRAR